MYFRTAFMRLISVITFFIVCHCVTFGQFKTGTITIDGNGNETSYVSEGTWKLCWDNDSLFIFKSGGSASEPAIIYFDIDPQHSVVNGTSTYGNLVGKTDQNITPNCPFLSDLRIYWFPSSALFDTLDKTGGWTFGANLGSNSFAGSGSSRELKIAWNQFPKISSRPSSFLFFGFATSISTLANPIGYSYDQTPSANPGGGRYATPDCEFYWQSSNTSSSNTENPFDYKSYTYLGTGGALGTISDIYNFTHYKNISINKDDKWIYNGDFIIDGSGAKVKFDNNPDSLIIGDSLIVLEGQLLLENSSSKIIVDKSISIYDTLIGSTNANSDLQVKLNFKNEGTFNPHKTKITFNGSSIAQTISGDVEADNSFGKLEVNNIQGLIDNSDDSLVIEDSLILTSGVIHAKKYVVLRDTTGVVPLGGSSSSYVDSTVIWKVDLADSVIFPIGNDGQHARLGIEPQSTSSGREYKASYNKNGNGDYTLDGSSNLDHVSYVEWWELDELKGISGSNKAAKISLYWSDYSETSNLATERDCLKVAHWDATDWLEVDASANTVYNSYPDSGVVKTLSYTSNFSPFTIGSAVSANPLPVDLLSFKGAHNKEQRLNKIHWSTASEINCLKFQLLKGQKLSKEVIYETECETNSNSVKDYYFNDDNLEDQNIYWLKQIDHSGQIKVFGPVILESKNNIQLFPNPSNGVITIQSDHKIKKITVTDLYGKKVLMLENEEEFTQIDMSGFRSSTYNVIIEYISGVKVVRQIVLTR